MGAPVMGALHMVPLNGERDVTMESLCRSLALVNAAAFFLESLRGVMLKPAWDQDGFIRMCIAAHAENVRMITDVNAEQARADVDVLARRLGIELTNITPAMAKGQVN